MECDISIEYDNRLQDSASLVAAALSSEDLPLTITNVNGQHLNIHFQPAREIFHPDVENLPSTSSLISFCHYNNHVEGHQSSISLCDPRHISGIISTEDNIFILSVRNSTGSFILQPQNKPSCAFPFIRGKRDAQPTNREPQYYSKYRDGKKRYVELALVADNSIYKKYKEDEKVVNDRMYSIATHMNALYAPLNVRIHLVWIEIWKDGDKFNVVESGDKTLEQFLTYRKTFIKEHPHDNAHMLTDLRFEAGVVGKAFKGTMCSYDYSGGVNVDHQTLAASVAATVAHEMGHNFGMEHDVDYGSTCTCPGVQCIMAPSAGNPPPSFWSDCSLRYLSNGFRRGIDLCLSNEPKAAVGGAKCGNGIVEAGEECDCGQEVCSNNCCDGKTCKLIGEAECATGDCCDMETCKPKSRATECRSATNICDLTEYCNGETQDCPGDFYVQDGHQCPGREGQQEFCFNGQCGSRQDQCKMIWGEAANTAIAQCFDQNTNGIVQGNCGYDVHYQNYTRCANEDKMCGRLHCEGQAERPIFGDPSTVISAYTYFRMGGVDHQCQVIKTQYVGAKKNQPDPGMVYDGAACGNDKICVEAKCRFRKDVNKTVSLCNDNCNFRGVCNNVGNCHCENGFGGVACEIPGFGGSVNSNTSNLHRGVTPSVIFLFLFCLLGVFFVITCIYYRVKRKRNLPSELWTYLRKSLKLQGVLVPVRKAPPPPGGRRKRESLNAMWGDATVTYSTTDRPPPFHPPVIPLMHATSPPIPTYTASHNQGTKVTLSRVPSLRPKDPPPVLPPMPDRPRPAVIEKLYEVKGEEMGLFRSNSRDKPLPKIPDEDRNAASPQPPSIVSKHENGGSKLSRSDSSSRPAKKPPPPPQSVKPSVAAKPKLPVHEPVVMGTRNGSSVETGRGGTAPFRERKEETTQKGTSNGRGVGGGNGGSNGSGGSAAVDLTMVEPKMDVRKMAAMFDARKREGKT